jgi:RHS repeat-associated protein
MPKIFARAPNITSLATQNIEFTYDKLSQLRKIDRAVASNLGHLVTDYSYDGAGRLATIANKFNSAVISNYNYGYDAGDRLSSKNGSDGNSTIDYGNDNQISGVDHATRPDESYSFNALGIRTGWTTDPLDTRRVLRDGVYEYQYDDEGNLTRKEEISGGKVTTYEWNYRNRLTKVTSGSQVVEYGYDAEDRRVSKKVNGVTQEKYVYDGDDIALVVDAAGTLVERYLYGDGVDNVLSVVKMGTTVWSLADRQGSVVDLVDEGGNVLNHFVYDSFGNRTATTGVDFRFAYTGRELDLETGLYYYRARYYDPMVGRFISEDPIGFSAGDTNLYRYVNNSPTNWTDPTGKFANLAAGAGFGALFGGLYALANDIESGQFGWNTFGNVLKGAAAGAAIGFVTAAGVGLLAAGATTAFGTSVAGAIVNTSFVAAGTAYGAYNAGGNFGSGKYLTGALDLFGVVAGAKNVFSGMTRTIPQMAYAELKARQANLAAMYPPDPNPPGYQRQIYQVGDPQLNSNGAMVPAGSSALANRTSVGGAVPYRGGNGSPIIVAADNPTISNTSAFLTRSSGEYDQFDPSYDPPEHVVDWWKGDRQQAHYLSTKYVNGKPLLTIFEGGTGDALAGHAVFRPMTTSPLKTTIPNGTYLTFWTKHNRKLPDNIGQLIETGEHDMLYKLFTTNKDIAKLLTGASTKLPGSQVYNHTFYPPQRLSIYENSMTIKSATPLSDLLMENMGRLDWAACTEVKW